MSNSSRQSGGRDTSSKTHLTPFPRTVRFRLTAWYSSLLLVFGIALVVALNLAVRLDHPDGYVITAGSRFEDIEWTPVRSPGGAITGFIPEENISLQEAENQLYSQNLDRLRNWSIIAVLGLAIASGVGGYLLSGMMLTPIRDITQAASEIGAGNLNRRINHHGPDDELKALADTFDSMIGRLEQSFEQQQEFVAHASHELRTPLAAILTNIEVTELDPEVSPEEYRALMDTIKVQTARLTRLSEDLLLLSSSDEERSDVDPVALDRLAAEVVDQLAGLAATKGSRLILEADDEVWAMADPDRLIRCVLNLVDNAIKYSGENATVRVAVMGDDSNARVTVRDDGPGIPPELREKIFDRFYRIDKSLSRRAGGAGLGLSIVRQLVQGMGGTVSVESQVGEGSAFTITLPAAPVEVGDPELAYA